MISGSPSRGGWEEKTRRTSDRPSSSDSSAATNGEKLEQGIVEVVDRRLPQNIDVDYERRGGFIRIRRS